MPETFNLFMSSEQMPKAHKSRKLKMLLYTIDTYNNDTMKNCQRCDIPSDFELIKTPESMRNSSHHNIAQEALYRADSSVFGI
jgi:hypothetical protein